VGQYLLAPQQKKQRTYFAHVSRTENTGNHSMSQPNIPSRRRLFGIIGVGGLTTALPFGVPRAQSQTRTQTFLNDREAQFVNAAVARLIPVDELGGGALEAGVPEYIDGQLNNAWGAGDRLYRSGPWKKGTASQGYQLPFTPAELFRNSVRKLNVEQFVKFTPAQQDNFLEELETSNKEFFDLLLALTIEGFFCDPVYGGNRNMIGWKLIGFPGAYSNCYDLVGRHNYAFTYPPVSLAERPHRSHQTDPNKR
jgi:gluconate 2-dehydrogenase gamma chain